MVWPHPCSLWSLRLPLVPGCVPHRAPASAVCLTALACWKGLPCCGHKPLHLSGSAAKLLHQEQMRDLGPIRAAPGLRRMQEGVLRASAALSCSVTEFISRVRKDNRSRRQWPLCSSSKVKKEKKSISSRSGPKGKERLNKLSHHTSLPLSALWSS